MLSVERLRRITVCRVDQASRLVVTATSSSLDLAALTSLHATRAGSVTVSRELLYYDFVVTRLF